MTPDELGAALRVLGWSNGELARRLAVDEATVRHWRRGQAVPATIAGWLRGLVEAHAAHPPPRRPGAAVRRWVAPGAPEC